MQGTVAQPNGAIQLGDLTSIEDCWEAMGLLADRIGEAEAAIAAFERGEQCSIAGFDDEVRARSHRRKLAIQLQRVEARKAALARQERREASETESRRLVAKLRAKLSPDLFLQAVAEAKAERPAVQS